MLPARPGEMLEGGPAIKRSDRTERTRMIESWHRLKCRLSEWSRRTAGILLVQLWRASWR
jgi:hypothetical protein